MLHIYLKHKSSFSLMFFAVAVDRDKGTVYDNIVIIKRRFIITNKYGDKYVVTCGKPT